MKKQSTQARETLRHLPILTNTARIAIAFAVFVFHLIVQSNGIAIGEKTWAGNIYLYLWEGIYACFIAAILTIPDLQNPSLRWAKVIKVIDIVMIAALMHIFGGISGGFGILILPFVATACINSDRLSSLAYAALSTILIFASSMILISLKIELQDARIFFQSGLLSAACFFVALLGSFGSANVRKTMLTMQKHETEIARLNALNKLVLEYTQEGMIVVEEGGEVLFFNQKAIQHLPNLNNASMLPELNRIVARWHNKINQPFEEMSNFTGYDVYIRATPVSEDNVPLLLIFMRSAAEIAEESHAAKLVALGQLTANLAHEIRNPLSAISHANELLLESTIDETDLQLQEIVSHNVRRINRMIEEILSLNKRDRIERKSLSLKTYLKNFLTEFMLSTPNSIGCLKINMLADVDYHIFVDEGHLHQILNNLMNNAWKYSKQNENAIRIAVSRRDNGYSKEVLIAIHDNGEGVPSKLQKKIFEPFFTTSNDGTGLGLYVARELAQANHGDLIYSASNNTFQLTLKEEAL